MQTDLKILGSYTTVFLLTEWQNTKRGKLQAFWGKRFFFSFTRGKAFIIQVILHTINFLRILWKQFLPRWEAVSHYGGKIQENVLLLLCWCFTALRHFSVHFGHVQLTYPYCSWASLLVSLPVLSAHSYASNWQLPFLNQRKEMAVEIISWPNSTKECCRTWGSNSQPSAYQADADPTELPCPARKMNDSPTGHFPFWNSPQLL